LPPAGSAAASASSSGAGNCALRSATRGAPSISAAWFSVKPVIANSNSPIRLIAELIQCHM
jgi:hypothetical protein